MRCVALALGLCLFGAVQASAALGPSAAEMCQVIQGDIAQYLATGHLCPCPYNRMRNGALCGNRSAWAKPGGRSPRCYFQDVTGEFPPNERPNAIRQSWPSPPPCIAVP